MDEKLLFAILGAAIAIISSWVKAWIDRETATSNELLKQRIQALNSIWLCFIAAKNTYAKKLQMDHGKWLAKYKDAAESDINAFRAEVDKHQIVLPHEVIEALRNIDTFMFGILCLDDQEPSEYQKGVEQFLNELTAVTNRVLAKRTHAVSLKFRT